MVEDWTSEAFCSYFRHQVEAIDSITLDVDAINQSEPGDFQIRLYKSTLLLTMLDAMAGIRFSKKYYPDMKNQRRFTHFVRDYADWDDGNLISVPFLSDRLSSSKSRDSKLADHLKLKLSRFDPEAGGAITVNKMDEHLEVLLSFAMSGLEEKKISECQHYAILYRYRNYLVHEAREPGYGMDFDSNAEAHYHSYLNDLRWFLVYPIVLLKQICLQCVDRLQQYLIDNQIDPGDIIKETSRF